MLLPIIICLFIATANSMNTTTFSVLPSAFASNNTSSVLAHPSTSNATIFAPLAAPLYRNVTAGDAWVFPSSPNDLGARDMSCECFNPGDQCCMPASSNVAPFCMPTGSMCCGDTFCVPGESCCGDFCCAANTVCNVKIAGSGCCPIGALCSGPTTCYDHSSSNCSKQASPPQQCCPANIPFCRDFKPSGLGCYASSKTASSTSSIPSMTAAGTSNVFVPSVSTSMKTKAIHTVTISVVSNGHGGVSLDFPTKSASGNSEGEETTYVLDWPATSTTPIAAVTSSSTSVQKTNTVGSSPATPKSTPSAPTTTTTAQSTVTSSSTTPPNSATASALCYDPTANSHTPCPTTTTTTTSSSSAPSATSATSSSAAFNPPGASIVKSQAPPTLPPDLLRNITELSSFLLPLLASCLLFYLTIRLLLFLTENPDDTSPDDEIFVLAPTAHAEPSSGGNKKSGGNDEKKKDTTVTVVTGSARPLLAPRVVGKGEIAVVEGSARPFVRGKRTHSLWEGMGRDEEGVDGVDGGDEGDEGEGEGEGERGLGHVFVGMGVGGRGDDA